MQWRGRRGSSNVDDRRRLGGGGLAVGGIGGLVVVLVVMFLGGDPGALLNEMQAPGIQAGGQPTAAEDELALFIGVVLADTEDVWHELFREQGRSYVEPRLVLFSGRVDSACGLASAAVGPFYCPADRQVYIDLSFYDELSRRFGASGDFAQAYVLAHEVGHHVQELLGTSDEMQALQERASEVEANQLSVRLELQADFYAGVWAHYAQRQLDSGDIEEALAAASAIGDDRLQRQTQGQVVPDSFTHGTSAQRVRWFRRGLLTGDLAQGDTFSARDL